jgi:hypothetical protein
VEILNSLQQQQQTNPQAQPQSLPQGPPNPTSTFSTDYFNSKNYGQHVFSNGAKYEGEFNANN